jgi:signal peptidase I
MSKAEYKSWAIAFAVGIILFFLLHSNFRIIQLTSPSVQYKWCIHLLNLKPKKGGLCVFERNGKTMVKYLIGMQGDKIKNMKDIIYVNENIVGRARRTKYLTPASTHFIPEGYAFVAGNHENSFDSRYEEYGLVDLKDIRGKAIGICKW